MKKKVSIRELIEYCEENRPRKVIFHTENQNWVRATTTMNIEAAFHSMSVFENPNIVCLKSGLNTIVFNRVKAAEIDTEATVLGTLITLFCGDFCGAGHNVSYTLIAT